ncbi:hypothetical protein PHLCEN_2v3879 [Hermanssonia centrifuga]|uniref:TspO/MBR-related protein n=1 Tax=Hermanssonia centrifuga TaxID=98765 RepID=A0A2R6QB93_9APHY|nr:hypothetical protein PHLCEN_2v3879 [Hermanssonia centrifuga]
MLILSPISLFLDVPRNIFTAVGLPLTAGWYSGSYTKEAVRGTWYKALKFPPGKIENPKVFPIVWSALYIALGYASHLAADAHDNAFLPADIDATSTGIVLYYAQLAMNFAWTPLFFGRKEPEIALVDSAMMTATSIYMTKLLHGPTKGKATWLLVPYCAWVSYVTYLNAGVVYLNRGRYIPKND